jgi:hypothetical protein
LASTVARQRRLVADRRRIVAFAGYHRDPRCLNRAEVAFAVSDAFQGHGIGTGSSSSYPKRPSTRIDTFDAYVIGDNRRMLDVFRDSGFAETVTVETGVCPWFSRSPSPSIRWTAPRHTVESPRQRRCGHSSSPASWPWSQPAANAERLDRKSEQSRHRRVHRRDRRYPIALEIAADRLSAVIGIPVRSISR